MTYRVLYFASLRDRAGTDAESVDLQAIDARALYAQLRARHGFTMGDDRLRVAINGEFVGWEHALRDGDEIAFIPPVSGG
ncbi:MAG: molybdopterin converting factor subunit 1 [Xanthomonadales bacterium PRO7]|jgi:molybdopterin synthase sulfur carrier subunit|nr:molybdopterin converting factor subunit 1 [Xanthomonadales bacterium PRO7]HMM57307.1 molybdopterin converting factor subunit 1 [Rudaea sp.]